MRLTSANDGTKRVSSYPFVTCPTWHRQVRFVRSRAQRSGVSGLIDCVSVEPKRPPMYHLLRKCDVRVFLHEAYIRDITSS